MGLNILLLDFSGEKGDWNTLLDLENIRIQLINIDEVAEQLNRDDFDILVVNFEKVEEEAPWVERILKASVRGVHSLPVVALVSEKDTGDVERALVAGCDLVMTKPYTIHDFEKKAALFKQ